MFQIFRSVLLEDKEAFLLHMLFTFTILLYMFVTNYAGQEIINHNNHIYFLA